jgi:hypothetical protein
MDTIDTVHQLLYYALINIRSEARENGDKVSYHLADLFHNAVVMMGQAAKGERSYNEVMAEIMDRAKAKRCEKWVEDHLKRMEAKV